VTVRFAIQINAVMFSSYGIPTRAFPYNSWLTAGRATACRPAVLASRQIRWSGLASAKLDAPLADRTRSIDSRAFRIAQPMSARTRAREVVERLAPNGSVVHGRHCSSRVEARGAGEHVGVGDLARSGRAAAD